jgi:hypothetical protein
VLDQSTGFWSFYTADPLSIFFKRFALVTTILVIVMMIDYAPAVRSVIAAATAQTSADPTSSTFDMNRPTGSVAVTQ